MPFNKTVLIVAPDTDLYYSSKEVESVVNLLKANLLNGNVEINDLLDRIRIVQPELIIFSTHGTKDGILLSDGIVGANALKPILSTTSVDCVYLNTCDSAITARKIHGELPVTFIANVQKIPDILAYITMASFAYHLSQGKSYQDSWILSRSGSDIDSQYFPSMSSSFGDKTMVRDVDDQIRDNHADDHPTVKQMSDLSQEVLRLSYLIHGSKEWNLIGILPTIAKLQRDCHQIRLLLILLLVLALLLIAVVGARVMPI